MQRTFAYASRPRVRASAAIGGVKEGKGPLRACFDEILEDDLMGQDSWEQAETALLSNTIKKCLEKGGLTPAALQALLCGDLLNQITPSSFAALSLGVPFLGLYGACSTAVQALVLGGALVDGGYRHNCLCAASSHFCSAERQYRFPLELGGQRPPSSQWTATAAGAFLLDADPRPALARLTHGTLGRVMDYRITDANQMGAAMAPAVADTLLAHFADTGRTPDDYDLIVTGDLGRIGRDILLALLRERGLFVADDKISDCGASLYYTHQDCHAGGSGCGCVASVTAGHFLPMLQSGRLKRLLVLGSGAMLSPTTSQQGRSIPGISFAAALEKEDA